MRTSLLEKYEGRDFVTQDKLIGVGITVGVDGITLDQQLYVESIVISGMDSTKVRDISRPLDPGMDLSARHDNEEELNPTIYPYLSILGQLMFVASMTRPDLTNSVRVLGRRAASPCMRDWCGLQHVLRYMAGTLDVYINYGRGLEIWREGTESSWWDMGIPTGSPTPKDTGVSRATYCYRTDR
ncbi:unnamed protein product [Choristocarpus tenellus]